MGLVSSNMKNFRFFNPRLKSQKTFLEWSKLGTNKLKEDLSTFCTIQKILNASLINRDICINSRQYITENTNLSIYKHLETTESAQCLERASINQRTKDAHNIFLCFFGFCERSRFYPLSFRCL